ncbi:PREDICTED: probable cyclic nucleotide-gated ion channel 3 [Tarenaya hassleriana]|uniref:probable cyclic nucleotide-gated ion channel 3 n=1 Tax=Tarenaya hassleriana TaxID=28532 RepID=UPI00053C48B6|nr:PREDICTED: probable cyclic nucleotide-gated ion channel 3 [Tarenaya hassleriana]XP_010534434.1 PREDICTED: probable cyclic nucleotide-gated ion channel 3 [Tarenaya hassleriana]
MGSSVTGERSRDWHLRNWKRVFLIVCVFALAFDPLFLYIPVFERDRFCLALDKYPAITACLIRTILDALYMVHILFYLRAPCQVSFRGEMLVDSTATAAKGHRFFYLMIDILSLLPVPQVLVLSITPRSRLTSLVTKEMLKWVLVCQYVPRSIRIYPLYEQVTRDSGRVTETKWAAAALNLLLYMLASNVIGAYWYLISIERKDMCWRFECAKIPGCVHANLYCAQAVGDNGRFLNGSCPLIDPDQITDPAVFNFGMFTEALQSGLVDSRNFPRKFLHCFWWGLRNLSALGQNLKTGGFVGDILFALVICVSGLVLFALFIGNMQKYLQSTTVRAEEMEEKRRDTEKWMSHRALPDELRERIRRYEQYRWRETRGVEEESLLLSLPKDIKRDTKHHLGLDLLRRVPLFGVLDIRQLEALCVLVKPVFYTKNSYIVRKGDPIEDMLFILRGNASFSSYRLRAGDFCCEELLEWALSRKSSHLPISDSEIQAITDVEGFVLSADDLKFVVTRYTSFHGRRFKSVFRYHSAQWRRWAACYIQAAWRIHKRRKLSICPEEEGQRQGTTLNLGAAVFALRFASNALRGVRARGSNYCRFPQKPSHSSQF